MSACERQSEAVRRPRSAWPSGAYHSTSRPDVKETAHDETDDSRSSAAVLPAGRARRRPKSCRCFLRTPVGPPLSGGRVGVGTTAGTAAAPRPVKASTRVEIAIPFAVRMLADLVLCSQKSEYGFMDPPDLRAHGLSFAQSLQSNRSFLLLAEGLDKPISRSALRRLMGSSRTSTDSKTKNSAMTGPACEATER